jgi:hypothetical protein
MQLNLMETAVGPWFSPSLSACFIFMYSTTGGRQGLRRLITLTMPSSKNVEGINVGLRRCACRAIKIGSVTSQAHRTTCPISVRVLDDSPSTPRSTACRFGRPRSPIQEGRSSGQGSSPLEPRRQRNPLSDGGTITYTQGALASVGIGVGLHVLTGKGKSFGKRRRLAPTMGGARSQLESGSGLRLRRPQAAAAGASPAQQQAPPPGGDQRTAG